MNLDAFLKASKEVVKPKPKPATTGYPAAYQGYQQTVAKGAAPQSAVTPIKTKPKEQPAIGSDWGAQFDEGEGGWNGYGYSGRIYR